MDTDAARDETVTFPVTHSILSHGVLLSEVSSRYDIGAPRSCTLLHHGLNDSYLVRTDRGRWVLRVYRAGRRSLGEIGWELDLLTHVQRNDRPVSVPVPQKSGERVWTVTAPEGPRHIVLFTYAEGQSANAEQESEERARQYGAAVAELHLTMVSFENTGPRVALDLETLIDIPLRAVQPLLGDRAHDWHYLEQLGSRLKARIPSLSDAGLAWGVCHGDCHGGNAHLNGEMLTFFDFDCSGPGWLAYDLGVFLWSTDWTGRRAALWPAYLEGYQSRRPLGGADLAALPLFAAIRQIWFMGLHAANAQDWGIAWRDDRHYDREIAFLQRFETEAQL